MSVSIIQQYNQPLNIDWKHLLPASLSSQGSLHPSYWHRDLWPSLGLVKCAECELLLPVGNVLGPVGEGEDDVSQRRQRQTLASPSLPGPADVCFTAPQIQEVKTTPAGNWETERERF